MDISTGASVTNPVDQLVDRWLKAINSADSRAALACYAEDAILHPTFRPGWHQGQEDIASYFIMLGARDGIGVRIQQSSSRQLGDDAGVADGHYVFFWQQGGKLIEGHARYSMCVARIEGSWKIVSHHSSALPD